MPDAWEPIREGMRNVLRHYRAGVARTLADLGFPLAVTESRVFVTPTENGWAADHCDVSVSGYEAMPRKHHEAAFTSVDPAPAEDVAALIVAHPACRLPFWSVFLSVPDPAPSYPEWPAEPERWTFLHVVAPASLEYLRALPSLARDDESLLERTAEEVVSVASADFLRTLSRLDITGIAATEDVLRAGDITVRTLSPSERGEHLPRSPLRRPMGSTELPSHAVEIRSESPRDQQPDTHADVSRVLAAFAVHGYSLATQMSVEAVPEPRWREPVRSGWPAPLPTRAIESRPLSAEDLAAVAETSAALRGSQLDEPTTRRELVVHRLMSGYRRDAPVDALLDFVVTLETLLLPYDIDTRRGDLTYRFRLHGALWLGEGLDERRDVHKELGALYEMRSRLVHGAGSKRVALPPAHELRHAAQVSREYATRAVRKVMKDGLPDAQWFTARALGLPG